MQTLVAEVLRAWRRAERLTKELQPGTPEHGAAMTACERLRDVYLELTSAVTPAMTEADARSVLLELDD